MSNPRVLGGVTSIGEQAVYQPLFKSKEKDSQFSLGWLRDINDRYREEKWSRLRAADTYPSPPSSPPPCPTPSPITCPPLSSGPKSPSPPPSPHWSGPKSPSLQYFGTVKDEPSTPSTRKRKASDLDLLPPQSKKRKSETVFGAVMTEPIDNPGEGCISGAQALSERRWPTPGHCEGCPALEHRERSPPDYSESSTEDVYGICRNLFVTGDYVETGRGVRPTIPGQDLDVKGMEDARRRWEDEQLVWGTWRQECVARRYEVRKGPKIWRGVGGCRIRGRKCAESPTKRLETGSRELFVKGELSEAEGIL